MNRDAQDPYLSLPDDIIDSSQYGDLDRSLGGNAPFAYSTPFRLANHQHPVLGAASQANLDWEATLDGFDTLSTTSFVFGAQQSADWQLPSTNAFHSPFDQAAAAPLWDDQTQLITSTNVDTTPFAMTNWASISFEEDNLESSDWNRGFEPCSLPAIPIK